jgi:RimJ/RimL family protein N-acetyltransferase
MPAPRHARPSKKQLWFQSGRYFIRTIRREDASDRWAGWLSDMWTVNALNTAPRQLQKSDIAEYIKQFDQRSSLLLGIFQLGTRSHVGFIRLDLDEAAGEALVSAIIGEAEHRNRGATTDVFVPLLDYLFDTLALERVTAKILDRNQETLRYLLRLGWQRDPVPETAVRSQLDGTTLQRWSVSWTRDGYRTFRTTELGRRLLRRISSFGG